MREAPNRCFGESRAPHRTDLRFGISPQTIRLKVDLSTRHWREETLTSVKSGKMGKIAEAIFGYLQRNAVDVESTFCLPPGQVVEIGTQIDV